LRRFEKPTSPLTATSSPPQPPPTTASTPSTAAYLSALAGLARLARSAAPPLLDALLAWRRDALGAAASYGAPGDEAVLARRLAAELVFLDAARVLVCAGGGPSLPDRQAAALEGLAFDWALHAGRYVGGRHADLAGPRAAVVAGAAALLAALSSGGGRLPTLGARFVKEVEARLAGDAAGAPRGELLALCAAFEWVPLLPRQDAGSGGRGGGGHLLPSPSIPTSSQAVSAAAVFVAKAHPLRHVAPARKSQVAHALCGVLGAGLGRLADADEPRAAAGLAGLPSHHHAHPSAASVSGGVMAAWLAEIAGLRADLSAWVARAPSKHGRAGLPLIAAALCLQDDAPFVADAPWVVGALHRLAAKDRAARVEATVGVSRLVRALARRPGAPAPGSLSAAAAAAGGLSSPSPPSSADRAARAAWLASAATPLLTAARKASAIPADHVAALVDLGGSLGAEHPALGVEAVVLGLLPGGDGAAGGEGGSVSLALTGPSVGLATAGARAALAILRQAAGGPYHGAGAGAGEDYGPDTHLLRRLAAASSSSTSPSSFLHDMGLPPDTVCRLRRGLGCTLASAAAALAPYRHPVQGSRPAGELPPRDRAGLAPLLAALFACVPFVSLSPDDTLLTDLPAWTLHAEPGVRAAAVGALNRCVRGLGAGAVGRVLAAAAALAGRLPDDAPDAQAVTLALVDSLGGAWARRLLGERGGVDLTTPTTSLLASAQPALDALDAAALALLCSPVHRVIGAAVTSLTATRDLGAAVASAAGLSAPTTRLLTVIDYIGDALALRCAWDWGLWADARAASKGCTWRPPSWRALMMMASGGSGRPVDPLTRALARARWVAEVGRAAGEACPGVAAVASASTTARLLTLLSRDGSPRPPATPTSASASAADAALAARVEVMAATACLACALPPPPPPSARRTSMSTPSPSFDAHASLLRALAAALRSATPLGGGPCTATTSTTHTSPADLWSRAVAAALGCAHASAHASLVTALRPLMDELAADRPRGTGSSAAAAMMGRPRGGRGARDDARAAVACVWRLAALTCPPGGLRNPESPLSRSLFDFVGDSVRWLGGGGGSGSAGAPVSASPASGDAAPEVQAVRLGVAAVARRLAADLATDDPGAFPPAARAALFDAMGAWCGPGEVVGLASTSSSLSASGLPPPPPIARLRADVARLAAGARARHAREATDSAAVMEAERAVWATAAAVESAALAGMAAMLLGPPLGGSSSSSSSSTAAATAAPRAMAWADRLLHSPPLASEVAAAARTATVAGLRNALAAEPAAAAAFVSAALGPSPPRAAAYTAALADVLAAMPLPVSAASLACVALFGAGARSATARRAAARVLSSLEARAWGGRAGGGGAAPPAAAAVVGDGDASADHDHDGDGAPLDEVREADQARLAARLASERPALAPALLAEAVGRVLPLLSTSTTPCPPAVRGTVRSLAPLAARLDMAGGGVEARTALDCLLSLTAALGPGAAAEAEALWVAVAKGGGEVAGSSPTPPPPALARLLVERAATLPAAADDCARAARWVARAAPGPTLDALVEEAATAAAVGDRGGGDGGGASTDEDGDTTAATTTLPPAEPAPFHLPRPPATLPPPSPSTSPSPPPLGGGGGGARSGWAARRAARGSGPGGLSSSLGLMRLSGEGAVTPRARTPDSHSRIRLTTQASVVSVQDEDASGRSPWRAGSVVSPDHFQPHLPAIPATLRAGVALWLAAHATGSAASALLSHAPAIAQAALLTLAACGEEGATPDRARAVAGARAALAALAGDGDPALSLARSGAVDGAACRLASARPGKAAKTAAAALVVALVPALPSTTPAAWAHTALASVLARPGAAQAAMSHAVLRALAPAGAPTVAPALARAAAEGALAHATGGGGPAAAAAARAALRTLAAFVPGGPPGLAPRALAAALASAAAAGGGAGEGASPPTPATASAGATAAGLAAAALAAADLSEGCGRLALAAAIPEAAEPVPSSPWPLGTALLGPAVGPTLPCAQVLLCGPLASGVASSPGALAAAAAASAAATTLARALAPRAPPGWATAWGGDGMAVVAGKPPPGLGSARAQLAAALSAGLPWLAQVGAGAGAGAGGVFTELGAAAPAAAAAFATAHAAALTGLASSVPPPASSALLSLATSLRSIAARPRDGRAVRAACPAFAAGLLTGAEVDSAPAASATLRALAATLASPAAGAAQTAAALDLLAAVLPAVCGPTAPVATASAVATDAAAAVAAAGAALEGGGPSPPGLLAALGAALECGSLPRGSVSAAAPVSAHLAAGAAARALSWVVAGWTGVGVV